MTTHSIYSDYGKLEAKLERRIEELENRIDELECTLEDWSHSIDAAMIWKILRLTPECCAAYDACMCEDEEAIQELVKRADKLHKTPN